MRGLGLGLGLRPKRSGSFTPLELGGKLFAWYDANDSTVTDDGLGNVTQVNDLSGNARHMTQATAANRPETGAASLNGRNVIQHDGSEFLDFHSDLLTSWTSGKNDVTLVMLVQMDTPDPTPSNRERFIAMYGNGTTQRRVSLGCSSGDTTDPFTLHSRAIRLDGESENNATVKANILPGAAGYLIWGIQLNPAAGSSQSRAYSPVDTYEGSNTLYPSTGAFPATACDAGSWFAEPDGSNAFFGRWAAAVFLDQGTSIDEMQKVIGFLAHKWGVASYLPVTHPYKYQAP